VPACGTTGFVGAGDCPAAQADPGVFQLSPTGLGEAGTACAMQTFNIMTTNPATGQVTFVPTGGAVVLTPPATANSVCRIDFTFSVLRAPTKPASASAPGTVNTAQIGFATGTAAVNGATGGGTGSSFVTVALARPGIATTATATAALGSPITDTATLSPATPPGPAPTGTITFTLFGPNDATCAGASAFTATVPVNAGAGAYASGPFTPTVPGTYRWVAAYSGDANNVAAATACNDAGESSVVSPPTPSIAVTKSPSPASLPAPGGPFQFTVVVTNTSAEALRLTALTDNVYGDLNGKGTCATGATLAASGGTYTCAFTGNFTGAAGASQTDTVTPVGTDVLGQTATATANATVTLTPAGTPPATPVPSISVTKTPSPTSLPAPGGTFSFTVVVTNTSTEALTLTGLTDNVYGNLNGRGTCATGATLPASGGTYKCTFTGAFTGASGASQVDTVTPVATDSGGRTATATAKATVTLTPSTSVVSPARLAGPGSCVQGPFKTNVTGTGIKRVTFSLNGKVVGVKTRRDSAGRFSLTIRPSGGAVQRVSAKIEYTARKFGTTHTIAKTFRVCTAPRFTG
jgi:hypothetical protein